jgi:GTP cyclohydrolase FolE2
MNITKNTNQNSENYLLSESDLKDDKTFESFLDKISDIASTKSSSNQTITNTGIPNQQVVIYIKDIETRTEFVPVFCDINIGVDLQQYRGVHMSRFAQSIFDLVTEKFDTLDAFTEKLANIVREKQNSQSCTIKVVGTYMYRSMTQKSKLSSIQKIFLISNAISTQDQTTIQTGMKVYNMTACPCTKAHTKYMIAPKLKALGLSIDQINAILIMIASATHTQRGTTTIVLDKESSKISHNELYSVFSESTHLLSDLLKRPDEHDLVLRTVQKSQFTEDVAREVADTAYYHFKNILSPNAKIYVESILNDAIHIHDVQTVIQKTFGDMQKELAEE